MKRFFASLIASLTILSAHGQIVYGTQVVPAHAAFIAEKDTPGQMAVGGQFNGWANSASMGAAPAWAFGIATEAVAFGNANPYLIGAENAVVNTNPFNFARKVANNAVFKCRMDNDPNPCARPSHVGSGVNNYDSIAYWVSAQPGTGFESALKLDVNSIQDSAHQHAAVIDLGDLDPARDYVLIRLPGGREVRMSEFVRALDTIH